MICIIDALLQKYVHRYVCVARTLSLLHTYVLLAVPSIIVRMYVHGMNVQDIQVSKVDVECAEYPECPGQSDKSH